MCYRPLCVGKEPDGRSVVGWLAGWLALTVIKLGLSGSSWGHTRTRKRAREESCSSILLQRKLVWQADRCVRVDIINIVVVVVIGGDGDSDDRRSVVA